MPRNLADSVNVDISSTPREGRVGAWTEAICENFYPLDISDPADEFEIGRLRNIAIPGVRLGALESDSYRVNRRRKHIGEGGGDYYFLPIPKKRDLVLTQSAQETVVKPGSFVVVSTSEPYQYLQETRNQLLTVRVDGPLMRERIPTIDDMLAGDRTGDLPLVRIFSRFVASVLMEGDQLDADAAQVIAPKLLDLLALALVSPESGNTSSESSARLAHLRRINLTIENRLSDFSFTPATLASELGLSKRYVQRILSESGNTASGIIKARRIATAQRRLADPLRQSESISSIAYSVGFTDVAHFSRAFRAAVGMSPREYRKNSLQGNSR